MINGARCFGDCGAGAVPVKVLNASSIAALSESNSSSSSMNDVEHLGGCCLRSSPGALAERSWSGGRPGMVAAKLSVYTCCIGSA